MCGEGRWMKKRTPMGPSAYISFRACSNHLVPLEMTAVPQAVEQRPALVLPGLADTPPLASGPLRSWARVTMTKG